jgi:hypothetical protein
VKQVAELDKEVVVSLRQELVAMDGQILALNMQIKALCWRRSPEGDRRQKSFVAQELSSDGVPQASGFHEERRMPTAVQMALLRNQLATALQRYMIVQSLLRTADDLARR